MLPDTRIWAIFTRWRAPIEREWNLADGIRPELVVFQRTFWYPILGNAKEVETFVPDPSITLQRIVEYHLADNPVPDKSSLMY